MDERNPWSHDPEADDAAMARLFAVLDLGEGYGEEDYKDARDLWNRPLLTRYEHARRVMFLRTRICNSRLLTRAFYTVERPIERVVWEIQHRYLLHTLKGIALEDYQVFIEDYEHWMSGSWESYLEERGYL